MLRVLGSVEFDTAVGASSGPGGPADLGGPLQRAVLARLAQAGGEVVPVHRLIDDLWRGEPPPRATGSLQAYVSNLRRVLEPDRLPRTPPRLLVTAPPGYALRLPAGDVDAGRFEALLAEARSCADADPERARGLLGDGLALWRGDAYAEFAHEPWAQPEVVRLTELRFAARELLVATTLSAGDAAAAVPEAEALARQAPLREATWRLLALALWHAGRQADALAALRRARATLAEELGLDPGPELAELETAVLRGEVTAAFPRSVTAGPPQPPADRADPEPVEPFVGRAAELETLLATAAEAATGRPRIVQLTGEAGAGKTTLLAHLRAELVADGWLIAGGRCPETEGAPPAWAWTGALRELAAHAPPGHLAAAVAPLLDDARDLPVGEAASDGRFRLHRAVAEWLRAAAARRPVAVILDDVHAADAETLLLATRVAELAGAAVLFVLAYRPTDHPERLTGLLDAVARRSPSRVHLDGLRPADVERLLIAVTGAPVGSATVAALAERTGGNPFYVRESARLLASEGALVATSEVPEGVRDVLRRRLARLPDQAVAVLRLAAVAGRECDVETLLAAAGVDEATVLDALEAGLVAGLLTEPEPDRVRFVHSLVHDTFYTDLPGLRRARLHARIAAAVARLRPDDHDGLTLHYLRAASPETAPLAVHHAILAAELAERRYAYDAAAGLLTAALAAADRVSERRDEQRVDLLGRLVRAQMRAGAMAAARRSRAQAVDLAVAAGRDDLLVEALTASTMPTPWLNRPYGVVDHHIVDVLDRLLRSGDLSPDRRCRLLIALADEVDGEAGPRGARAGREALALARTLDDPGLLAAAVTARLETMRSDLEPDEREALGRELAGLADEHGFVVDRWYAELVLGNVAGVRNRPAALRAAIEWQGALARRHRLNEAQAIDIGARACLAHIGGDFDLARRLYDDASQHLYRQGSLHADAYRYITTATLLISQGRFAEHLEPARRLHAAMGPVLDDHVTLALIANGRIEEARARPIGAYDHRTDWNRSALLTVRAMVVVALDRPDLAPPLIDDFMPVREQLAGFSTSSIAFRPVATTLGELFRLCGREEEAQQHFTLGARIARIWGSPHWLAEAEAAAARQVGSGSSASNASAR